MSGSKDELEAAALTRALDGANEEISRLERALLEQERRAERERAELEAELAAARVLAARYRGALEAVLSSRSWKLTRPLRKLRRSDRPELDALSD